jgi:hypothetical protein
MGFFQPGKSYREQGKVCWPVIKSSYIITDGQSASLSWCQAVEVEVTLWLTVVSQSLCLGVKPTLGPVTRYYFMLDSFCMKVAALFL